MTKTTIELLREAREWLADEAHWCPFARWRSDGANCAMGALDRVTSPYVHALNWHSSIHCTIEFCQATERLGAAARILNTDEFERGKDPYLDPYAEAIAAVIMLNNYGGWKRTKDMFDLAIKLDQEEMDRQAKELVESSVGEAVAK